MKAFDWDMLDEFVATRNPVEVSCGLLEDWFWTAASVYENGEWKDIHAPYLRSDWATPGFKAEMENGDVIEVVAMIPSTPDIDAEYERRFNKAVESIKRYVNLMGGDKE